MTSGGPRGRMVKDAYLKRSKSLVISPMWVRAYLGSYVRQTMLCMLLVECRVFFFLGDLSFPPHLTIDSAQNE